MATEFENFKKLSEFYKKFGTLPLAEEKASISFSDSFFVFINSLLIAFINSLFGSTSKNLCFKVIILSSKYFNEYYSKSLYNII